MYNLLNQVIILTKKERNITLAELIDLDFLQEFQDFFAKNMGIAAITTDENGPITKASNFTGFCTKFVRGEKTSLEKCDGIHIDAGVIAGKKGETHTYTCPNGLTEFAVPIMIKGKYIASIIGGQFFSQPPSEEDYRKVAKDGNFDEEEYLKEINRINVISTEKLDEMAHLLTLLTKNIENIAVKNFELIEKNRREDVYRYIEEIMRTSFDVNLIKKEIVKQIGDYFDADRVVFADYNPAKDNYSIAAENEYRSSDDIKTFVGVDFISYPGFAEAIRNIHIQGKDIIFNDLDKYIQENNLSHTGVEHFYKEMGFISSMAINISHNEIFYGNLVISYNEKNKISDDDIKFIQVLANKAGTSLYEADLYTKTIQQAEREKLNRNMIEILRSTLDRNMIKHLFVKNLGKFLNADRVFFSEYDADNKTYLPVDNQSEYLSNPTEKSFINFDFANPDVQGFLEPLLNKRELLIHNWEEYIKAHPQNEEFLELYKDANIKSGYKFPVMYENKLMGFFCVDFTDKYVELSDEDINRIRNICTQAGIALYQAEMYEEAQKAISLNQDFLTKISDKIKEPVNKIINDSRDLSEAHLELNGQKTYMDKILESCNQLLNLTNDISPKEDAPEDEPFY